MSVKVLTVLPDTNEMRMTGGFNVIVMFYVHIYVHRVEKAL